MILHYNVDVENMLFMVPGINYIVLTNVLKLPRRLGAKGSYLTLVRVADRIL